MKDNSSVQTDFDEEEYQKEEFKRRVAKAAQIMAGPLSLRIKYLQKQSKTLEDKVNDYKSVLDSNNDNKELTNKLQSLLDKNNELSSKLQNYETMLQEKEEELIKEHEANVKQTTSIDENLNRIECGLMSLWSDEDNLLSEYNNNISDINDLLQSDSNTDEFESCPIGTKDKLMDLYNKNKLLADEVKRLRELLNNYEQASKDAINEKMQVFVDDVAMVLNDEESPSIDTLIKHMNENAKKRNEESVSPQSRKSSLSPSKIRQSYLLDQNSPSRKSSKRNSRSNTPDDSIKGKIVNKENCVINTNECKVENRYDGKQVITQADGSIMVFENGKLVDVSTLKKQKVNKTARNNSPPNIVTKQSPSSSPKRKTPNIVTNDNKKEKIEKNIHKNNSEKVIKEEKKEINVNKDENKPIIVDTNNDVIQNTNDQNNNVDDGINNEQVDINNVNDEVNNNINNDINININNGINNNIYDDEDINEDEFVTPINDTEYNNNFEYMNKIEEGNDVVYINDGVIVKSRPSTKSGRINERKSSFDDDDFCIYIIIL